MTAWLIRALLRMAPPEFRRRSGGDFLAVHLQRARRRRGALGRIGFSIREIGGAALLVVRLRTQGEGVGSAPSPTGVWVGDLARSVRHAGRSLLKSPRFTVMAVGILGIGVGANTAIFSVVDALFLDDPPHVVDPDRLVRVYRTGPDGRVGALQHPDYEYLRDANAVFAGLAGSGGGAALALRAGEACAGAVGGFVSYNYFDVLGTRPEAGRWFLPEEDRDPGASLVAVIDHGLAESLFGSPDQAVGRSLDLNGTAFTVVGVAPEAFRGPSPVESPPDVWMPFHAQPALLPSEGQMLEREPNHVIAWVTGIGRLRDGIGVEAARANVAALSAYLEATFPDNYEGPGAVFGNVRFAPEAGRAIVAMTRLLVGVAVVVLLIVCANIAILLLARGSERARSYAVRIAMGASRRRVVREALTESLLLAGMGSAVGVAVAYFASGAVAALIPDQPSVSFDPDASVAGFAVLVALSTALLFGTIPALHAGRVEVNDVLRGHSPGRERSRLRGGLVIAQVSLAVCLAGAAALTVGSFVTASTVPLGYDIDDRVVFSINFGDQGYSDEESRAFIRDGLERVVALPGVLAASASTVVPFQGSWLSSFDLPTGPDAGESRRMIVNAVAPDYFRTMDIEIVAGRPIDGQDVAGATRALVVSESTARRLWPGQDPVGQRLYRRGAFLMGEVVGVAEDTRVSELGSSPEFAGYYALDQSSGAFASVVVHGTAPVAALRDALLAEDPDFVVSRIQTMDEVIGAVTARFRTSATLVGIFGSVALALAMAGLYGVLSYSVVRERKEIGVRVALGASTRRVGSVVVRRALALTLTGLLLGGSVALLGAPLLSSFLYEVEARDPLLWTGAAASVVLVAVAASLGPALRAARVDPMVALRSE